MARTPFNRDFRYQLTVIGEFARAMVSEEIKDNEFVIRTDPGRFSMATVHAGYCMWWWACPASTLPFP
jgi:hypothetical protein